MTESVAVQLRRRRLAAYRCPPMACCRCRDPLSCRCHSPADKITDPYVDGYRDAAEHLLDAGLAPAPNISSMRVMWRRGGHDQEIARRISELWEVAA
jgi:hypothetical protein